MGFVPQRELLTKLNLVESNQIFSRGLNCFPVFYLVSCLYKVVVVIVVL